nr:PREDICTED: V-set and immunoglobulin domain-containing protein 10-like [Latimeria chalumnae]|eukprot:XP_014343701.1 PREDICTED: V-set and immunoglobulin domain-containing protein 10-like [Latimeria chalumnae]
MESRGRTLSSGLLLVLLALCFTAPINSVSIAKDKEPVEKADVTLSCNRTVLKWEVNGTTIPLPAAGYEQSENSLTIKSIQRTQSGNYTCIAGNTTNNESATEILKVYYGPDGDPVVRVNGTEGNRKDLSVGNWVTLECAASSYPVEYTWRFGSTFMLGLNYYLRNVQLSHSGTYTCEAKNVKTNTVRHKDISINVYERIEGVKIEQRPTDVVEGDAQVTLNCTTSRGKGGVTWTRDGAAIEFGRRYSTSGTALEIKKPVRGDSGEFACTVKNPINDQKGEAKLSVYYGPENIKVTLTGDRSSDPTQNVLVNSTLNFTCASQSDPPAQYIWTTADSSDNNVPEGAVLILNPVKLSDAGVYSCIAENEKTNKRKMTAAHIMVYELPVGDPVCTLESTNSNTGLRFNCLWPGGHPKPRLQFDGLSDSTSSESSLKKNVSSTANLSGKTITCIGSHIVRSQNCTIVPLSPTNYSPSKCTSLEGSGVTVTLQCAGQSNPPALVQWSKGSQGLANGGKYSLSSDTTSLAISNFSLEADLGNYTCNCRNPMGAETKTLTLTEPVVSTMRVSRSADGTSATVEWQTPDSALMTAFFIEVRGPQLSLLTRESTTDWTVVQELDGGNRSTVVSPLQADASYSFRVTPGFGAKQGTPSAPQTAPPPGTGLTQGQIAGIAVGSVLGALLLIALIILVVFLVRRRNTKNEKIETKSEPKAKQAMNGRPSQNIPPRTWTPSQTSFAQISDHGSRRMSNGTNVSHRSQFEESERSLDLSYNADDSNSTLPNNSNRSTVAGVQRRLATQV